LSDHAKVVNDRVDLGHRVFLAGFFTAFAIGPLVAIVGKGLTKDPSITPWIPWLALLNAILLMGAAHYLYAGRKWEKVIWVVGLGFLALAIISIFMGKSHAAYYLAAQLMMPALFAAIVATPPVRVFLANLRGEAPPPETAPRQLESILATSPDGASVAIREDAKGPALTYSRVLRLGAGLMLLCVVGGIVMAVRSLLSTGNGWLVIVVAVLSVPSSFALMTLADDWYYVSTTKGYEKAHLANIVKNSQLLRNFVTAAIVIVALLAILEVAMR
jgi:hypothetical protein